MDRRKRICMLQNEIKQLNEIRDNMSDFEPIECISEYFCSVL